ncbi:MAG: ABC transporter permease [Treponema sp.]|jgi:ribose/xylose/arabinose/galactoside ABC-type transport system permease subunit|nr:ABC transporter permease [Treponema sp.]
MKINIPKIRELPILLILAGIAGIITVVNPSFITLENLMSLFKSNLTLSIMSLGMLMVLLTGGIDVSTGALIAVTTYITAQCLVRTSSNLFVVFFVSCFSGIVMGIINGWFISRLKIPPIITTLGTMNIFQGVLLYLTGGSWVTELPENFIMFGRITVFNIVLKNSRSVGFPVQGFIFIFAIILTWFLLKKTVIGRGVYALGGNRESAERMGYKPNRILTFVYAYEGLLVGLAAVSHTSIMRQVDPNAFLGFEMQVIAALVLGGVSTAGGTGSILGTLLGVAVFCVINNGLILMKIPTYWQKILVGIIIIVSISVDMFQKQRAERKQIRVDVE